MRATEILLEKQNYEEMFNDLLKSLPEDDSRAVEKHVIRQISWARNTLRRRDRIVWWLKAIKMHYLIMFSNKIDESAYNKIKKKLERTFGSPLEEIYDEYHSSIGNLRYNLEHWVSLNTPYIQDIEFNTQTPMELEREMVEAEEKYKEKQKEKDKAIEPRDDDYILINFDDAYAWWVLPRPYCENEADSMGHCGNAPSHKPGDRILSLRRKVDDNLWAPHLTFIRNQNGYLGEMKGRGNDKPVERYHPYIIELLQSDYIKGIIGGGYLSENNFSMEDLDEEKALELIEEKPGLAPIETLYNKFGPESEDYQEKLKDCLISFEIPVEHISEDGIVTEKWPNLEALFEELGDSNHEDLLNATNDPGTLVQQLDINVTKQSFINDFLNKLPDNIQQGINNYLQKIGWENNEDRGDFILQNDDNMMYLLEKSFTDGHYNEIVDIFKRNLMALLDEVEMLYGDMAINGELIISSNNEVYYEVEHDQVIELLSSEEEQSSPMLLMPEVEWSGIVHELNYIFNINKMQKSFVENAKSEGIL